MPIKKKKRKEEKEGKENDSNKFLSLLGKKTKTSTFHHLEIKEFPIVQNKCLKNDLLQGVKYCSCYSIHYIKKIYQNKDDNIMENKYIYKKFFKRENPEAKKQNIENINFLKCESFIKGRNMHKYLINDNQKKIFKNQLNKSCIFLDEKEENLQNEENKLSIINIYNNHKNKKKIFPIIKQN